tara:strand:- start:6425 stop:6658 length:234 start_codon:yes stop_codon:yes gene_type:complete
VRPFGFAALLKLPGALANSALRTSDTASAFFPTALRYSPAQMGLESVSLLVSALPVQVTKPEKHAALQPSIPSQAVE